MQSVLSIYTLAERIKADASKTAGWENAPTIGFPAYGLNVAYWRDGTARMNVFVLAVSRTTDILYNNPENDFEDYLFDTLHAFFSDNLHFLAVKPPRSPFEVATRLHKFYLPVADDWETPIPPHAVREPYYLIEDLFEMPEVV